MKTPPESNDDNTLLDAILSDESWQALESSLRRDSLASLRIHRRRRSFLSWSCRIGALALLFIASLWLFQHHSSLPPNSQKTMAVVPTPAVIIRNFTDDELLAMFPKGSCLVAEVDGQPRLIVLDDKMAAEGFAMQ